MNEINICLQISSHFSSFIDDENMEKEYQNVYSKLLSYLYVHPNFLLSFSLTGCFYEFFEQYHPECLNVLRELITRKQIEIIGGGYYDPIFPLIPAADKTLQISKMENVVKRTVGIRPKGLSIFGSVWESSLVRTFKTNGVLYVQLDSSLIPPSGRGFYPIITNDNGKNIFILPLYKEFIPLKTDDFISWTDRIRKAVLKSMKKFKDVSQTVVTVSIDSSDFIDFMSSKVFLGIQENIDMKYQYCSDIRFNLPQKYLDGAKKYISSYIPAGMEWQIARWSRRPFENLENKTRFPLTIYDYLNVYKDCKSLYDRIVYLELFLSHGGDRVRKNFARERICEAQSGHYFISLPSGLPAKESNRQTAYHILNEADRILRESDKFKPSISAYDYNDDGHEEYICRLPNTHFIISPFGAQICELNMLLRGGSYASSLSRNEIFDGVSDEYRRGFFVEHLLTEPDFEEYIKNGKAQSEVFASLCFCEKKFKAAKGEIQLFAQGLFSTEKEVSLQKNYSITDSSITLQYILKNESKSSLSGVFVVEANFAKTSFEKSHLQYSAELILDECKKDIELNNTFYAKKGVSALRITDKVGKMLFNFEPNEESGFVSNIFDIKRPVENAITTDTTTMPISFFWNVSLEGGASIEKTVNLSIVPYKNKSV